MMFESRRLLIARNEPPHRRFEPRNLREARYNDLTFIVSIVPGVRIPQRIRRYEHELTQNSSSIGRGELTGGSNQFNQSILTSSKRVALSKDNLKVVGSSPTFGYSYNID